MTNLIIWVTAALVRQVTTDLVFSELIKIERFLDTRTKIHILLQHHRQDTALTLLGSILLSNCLSSFSYPLEQRRFVLVTVGVVAAG